MPRIFISHAVRDAELVEEFVDLLQLGVGVKPDDCFCSSLPGMTIPNGAAFISYIKTQVSSPELVLLMISPDFLKSPFCHNEVGASWGLSLPIYPMLIPPVDYKDVRGVLDGTQMAKLDDKEKLNDLRDDITEKLGLTPYRTSHWERKRDKFLTRLAEIASPRKVESKTGNEKRPPEVNSGLVVTSSGTWLKLDDRFYVAERVEHHDSKAISLTLIPNGASDESALNKLRPPDRRGGPIVGFAYQEIGGMARIEKMSSVSQSGKNIWSVDLTIADSQQQGAAFSDMAINFNNHQYTPDDIATMRAGRLLVNDPPPPSRRSQWTNSDLLESAITGRSDSLVRTDKCVIQSIIDGNAHDLKSAIAWARLEAVFRLKGAGIVESILELSLGPINGKKLHVRFRGQRPRRYQNFEPEMITVEGDCQLG